MIKISAIILAKNEENMIVDAIDSVSFCDEVLIVDNGSTDRTRDVARNAGAQVIGYGNESFAQRRDYGKSKAKGVWLLYIDADERVDDTLKKEIKAVIDEKHQDVSAYRLNRRNFYFGKHEWPTTEHIVRLFRKNKLKEWTGDLHETAIIEGKIGNLNGYLEHYTHRDLQQMVAKTNEWSEIEALLRLRAHHPKLVWWRFFRVMGTAFWDSYVKQKGYKAGTVGFIESMYQAYSMFITYAKLWEMQESKTQH